MSMSSFFIQLNGFKYFYTPQFNISHLFAHIVCSVWLTERTLSGATTPGQSGSGNNSNEGVLRIPQISKSLPLDGLMSYPGHWLGQGSYLAAEIQLVYCTATANWAVIDLCTFSVNIDVLSKYFPQME